MRAGGEASEGWDTVLQPPALAASVVAGPGLYGRTMRSSSASVVAARAATSAASATARGTPSAPRIAAITATALAQRMVAVRSGR